MHIIKYIPIALILITFAGACTQSANSQTSASKVYESEAFKAYWYDGKAEVNTYTLEQSRYGETRSGKAVLIFVTESFSKTRQVKLDNPDMAGGDKVTVMKLNYTKNFVTGIYPYSMMLSTFTPVSRNQYPNTLKVTMSSQEWCGHTFSQLNLEKNKYAVASYSYFEKEGDKQFKTDKVLLEDELFNLIRVAPNQIPVGETSIIPGLFFTRLKHENLRPTKVILSRSQKENEVVYGIQFEERLLTIRASDAFPHQILGWEEEFVEGGKKMYTKATLDKTLHTDYWNKNKNEHNSLRDSLGLSSTNY